MPILVRTTLPRLASSRVTAHVSYISQQHSSWGDAEHCRGAQNSIVSSRMQLQNQQGIANAEASSQWTQRQLGKTKV